MLSIIRRPSLGPATACVLVTAAMVLSAAATPAFASVLSVPVPTGWNAISLPYQPVNGDPYYLFDELRPPTQQFDLLSGNLHRYDNGSSSYATYQRQTPTLFGLAERGEGYWLWVSQGTVIGYDGVPPSSVPSITLQGAGWHLIGLPRLGDFWLADVLVTRHATGEKKLLADAVAAQWIQLPILGIERADGEGSGTNYVPLPATPGGPLTEVAFETYGGYWVNQFVGGLTWTFDKPPTGLTAQATSFTEVSLSWSDNSPYDTGYEVERRISPAAFQRIASLAANTTAYTDSTVSASTTYEYRVRGVNAAGFTAYSNTASVTTPDPPGAAPIGTAVDVVTDGSYAYIASSEYGVVVVDVRDPASPRGVGAADLGFAPTHLDRDGQTVVAVGGDAGLAVVNVSNPAAPALVGSLDGMSVEVALNGRYAYVTDATPRTNGYLRIVDLVNPSNPVQVASLPLASRPGEIAAVGNYAYVTGVRGMSVVDVRAPSAPVVVGSLTAYCECVTAEPGMAYTDGVTNGGIFAVDVSAPADPVIVGEHCTMGVLARFVVQDGLMYGTWQDLWGPATGLRIIDVSDPSSPFNVGSRYTPGTAQGVAVSGQYVYIAGGSAGLYVIDVSSPSYPVIVANPQ